MKRVIHILIWVPVLLCIAIAALVVKIKLTYDREFDALRDVIRTREGLTIVDQWRHEDVTLEDFGFLIRCRTGQFWIDINDDTRVRMPDDHVAGLLVQSGDGTGQRAVSIDSPYWESERLPRIRSTREFLQNVDAIIVRLKESPPPVTNLRGGPFAEYSLYLRVRFPKPPNSELAPATPAATIPVAEGTPAGELARL